MRRRLADRIDALLLRALIRDPEQTNLALSDATGIARNTVRARKQAYEEERLIFPFERRVDPAFLGYPMRAYVITKVTQRKLEIVAEALRGIPEVVEAHGISGPADVLVLVVARGADDLYRIAGRILDIDGVKRTSTGLVMRDLVPHRVAQLIPRSD